MRALWPAIMRIMAEFGSASPAGYTILIRVIVFALLPSWGIANAAATMVGQNLGAGDTVTPTWINLVSFWVLQIPPALVFSSTLSMGEAGIFWSIAIAQTSLALIAGYLFKTGKWKETGV
jgi:Na+-driven multidrug efflux pump